MYEINLKNKMSQQGTKLFVYMMFTIGHNSRHVLRKIVCKKLDHDIISKSKTNLSLKTSFKDQRHGFVATALIHVTNVKGGIVVARA